MINLRHLVSETLATSTSADPGDVAAEVLAKIPPRSSRAALEQTLRLFVRQVISETRTGASSGVAPIRPSAKVAAIRDGWQRRLADRVHVEDGWKHLRDCTYDDLLFVASERQELADRNAAWARTYRAFASALLDAGVDTMGDLPVETQMHLLGRVA